jgi:DnaK suppressor protein
VLALVRVVLAIAMTYYGWPKMRDLKSNAPVLRQLGRLPESGLGAKSMAKKPALTKTQLQTLRRRLEDERKRLLRVIEIAEAVPTRNEEAIEFDEAGQRGAEEEHGIELAEQERSLLTEIEHALAKMDAGTYGVSEKSGAPIPYARLRAVPWARSEADQ